MLKRFYPNFHRFALDTLTFLCDGHLNLLERFEALNELTSHFSPRKISSVNYHQSQAALYSVASPPDPLCILGRETNFAAAFGRAQLGVAWRGVAWRGVAWRWQGRSEFLC